MRRVGRNPPVGPPACRALPACKAIVEVTQPFRAGGENTSIYPSEGRYLPEKLKLSKIRPSERIETKTGEYMSYSKLYFHFIFRTKYNLPAIDIMYEREL